MIALAAELFAARDRKRKWSKVQGDAYIPARRIRNHFATVLARNCLQFTMWGEKGKEQAKTGRVAALRLLVAEQCRKKTGDAQMTLPEFMEPGRALACFINVWFFN